ncbi:MAG: hypothetical protein AB7F25_02100 [Deferribacterales bacterium]
MKKFISILTLMSFISLFTAYAYADINLNVNVDIPPKSDIPKDKPEKPYDKKAMKNGDNKPMPPHNNDKDMKMDVKKGKPAQPPVNKGKEPKKDVRKGDPKDKQPMEKGKEPKKSDHNGKPGEPPFEQNK